MLSQGDTTSNSLVLKLRYLPALKKAATDPILAGVSGKGGAVERVVKWISTHRGHQEDAGASEVLASTSRSKSEGAAARLSFLLLMQLLLLQYLQGLFPCCPM